MSRLLVTLFLVQLLPGPAWAGSDGLVVVFDVEGAAESSVRTALIQEIHAGVFETLTGQPYSIMTRERTASLVERYGADIDQTACRQRGNCEVSLGRRMVAALVLSSSVSQVDGWSVLDMKVFDTRSGQLLVSKQAKATSNAELVSISSALAGSLLESALETQRLIAEEEANAVPPPPVLPDPATVLEQKLRADAAAAWDEIAALHRQDPAAARPRMVAFVDQYQFAMVPAAGSGSPRAVDIPQVNMAIALLKAAEAAEPKEPGELLEKHGMKMVVVPTAPSGGLSGERLLVSDTEVAQGLYVAVVGINPSYFSSCGNECPVETVSWFEAASFCNALSAAEGLVPAYEISEGRVRWSRESTGYRLLTTAEWSAVAAAGADFTYAGSNSVREVGWTVLNSDELTHPSRRLRPNEWGVYDMSGNVAEWVWDAVGNERSLRGGAYSDSAIHADVSASYQEKPRSRSKGAGFRLARTVPGSPR